jgi:rhodanese-related sulfurtransferase
MKRWTLLLAGILATTLLAAGCATTTSSAPPPEKAPAAKAVKIPVPQDPELKITTAQVMEILAGPDAEKYFIVDARPAVKFDAGHVPGAVSIPKAILPKSLDKLPKDKTIIFYCGGLHCKLSPQSADIAMKAGFDSVKVWYEGQPGWVKAGNYSIIETKAVEKML